MFNRGTGQTKRFNNKPQVIDGVKFASIKEANRGQVLKVMQKAGLISGLEFHPKYTFEINGRKAGTYTADSRYTIVATGERVVEDVKSSSTAGKDVYRLKKKLMWAFFNIEIKEA